MVFCSSVNIHFPLTDVNENFCKPKVQKNHDWWIQSVLSNQYSNSLCSDLNVEWTNIIVNLLVSIMDIVTTSSPNPFFSQISRPSSLWATTGCQLTVSTPSWNAVNYSSGSDGISKTGFFWCCKIFWIKESLLQVQSHINKM